MTKRTFVTLAALGVFAWACGESDGPTLSSGGQVNVILTDAPFPFSQVKQVDIFITRIDAKLADVDSAAAANHTDSAGWKTITTPNASFNLLTFRNGATANLGGAVLPVGTYRSFRLVIDTDKSSITLNDNTKPDIKWPSAGKNGIKLILDQPFEVTNGTTNLLIDFDVGRSFVVRGNSISQNGLLFKPVIHATTQQSTGAISGSVRGDSATGTPINGATVEVLKAGTALNDTASANVVRTGVTDASGNYSLAFVPPGTYVVRATPPSGSPYKPALLSGGAVITAGGSLTNKVIIVTK